MPCDTTLKPGQSLVDRNKEIDAALKKLENNLTNGQVVIKIGPNGGIQFVGLSDIDRSRCTDACIVRSLTATNSWAFKQALLKAEQISGRKLNMNAVISGIHTHDGKTWQKH